MSDELRAGDEAPAFDLASTSGGRTSLRDWSGKRVLLYFYPKDETTG